MIHNPPSKKNTHFQLKKRDQFDTLFNRLRGSFIVFGRVHKNIVFSLYVQPNFRISLCFPGFSKENML